MSVVPISSIPRTGDALIDRHLSDVADSLSSIADPVYGSVYPIAERENLAVGALACLLGGEARPADRRYTTTGPYGVVTDVAGRKARVAFHGERDITVDSETWDPREQTIIYLGEAGVGTLTRPVPGRPGEETEGQAYSVIPIARPILMIEPYKMLVVMMPGFVEVTVE